MDQSTSTELPMPSGRYNGAATNESLDTPPPALFQQLGTADDETYRVCPVAVTAADHSPGRTVRPRAWARTSTAPPTREHGTSTSITRRPRGPSLLADGLHRLRCVSQDDDAAATSPEMFVDHEHPDPADGLVASQAPRNTSRYSADRDGQWGQRGTNASSAASAARAPDRLGGQGRRSPKRDESPTGHRHPAVSSTTSAIHALRSPPMLHRHSVLPPNDAPPVPPVARHHLPSITADSTAASLSASYNSPHSQHRAHFGPASREQTSAGQPLLHGAPSLPIPIPHRPDHVRAATPLTARYRPRFILNALFPHHSCSNEGNRTVDSSSTPTSSPTSATSRVSSEADVFDTHSLLEGSRRGPHTRHAPALSVSYRSSNHSTLPHASPPSTPPPRPWQLSMPLQRSDRGSSARTPSYLSPHRTAAPPALSSGMATRKVGDQLQLPSLPRFHPAVYQSPNTGPTASPTHLRSPPLLPASHAARASPQQQLYQYQRDLIAGVARAAAVPLTPQGPRDTPKAPSLAPCGSPGPATPLALEGPSDYLTAGIVGEGESRQLAEKYIREERERRNGMGSTHSSPAVSPAGGR